MWFRYFFLLFHTDDIIVIAILLQAGDSPGPWENPTVVYINSITVTGDVFGPYTFDTDPSPLTAFEDNVAGTQLGHIADTE